MALWETGSVAGAGAYLDLLKAFAETNGWTIDLYVASSRAHLHKGANHFELYVYSGDIRIYGCTGYASGSAYNAQPGTNAYYKPISPYTTSAPYIFVSCGNTLYFMAWRSYYGKSGWGCIGEITDKIGAWNGGQFFCGMSGGGDNFFTTDSSVAMYFEGAWHDGGTVNSTTSAAGSVVGMNATGGTALSQKQPNPYNLGILPIPVALFRRNPDNTAQYIPIGYAPGLRLISGGDVYTNLEEITIGADSCLLTIGNLRSVYTEPPKFCFTLGA